MDRAHETLGFLLPQQVTWGEVLPSQHADVEICSLMLCLLMFLLAQTMWGWSGETTQQPDRSLRESWRGFTCHLVLTTTCSAVVLQASRMIAFPLLGVCTLWVLTDGRHMLPDC